MESAALALSYIRNNKYQLKMCKGTIPDTTLMLDLIFRACAGVSKSVNVFMNRLCVLCDTCKSLSSRILLAVGMEELKGETKQESFGLHWGPRRQRDQIGKSSHSHERSKATLRNVWLAQSQPPLPASTPKSPLAKMTYRCWSYIVDWIGKKGPFVPFNFTRGHCFFYWCMKGLKGWAGFVCLFYEGYVKLL